MMTVEAATMTAHGVDDLETVREYLWKKHKYRVPPRFTHACLLWDHVDEIIGAATYNLTGEFMYHTHRPHRDMPDHKEMGVRCYNLVMHQFYEVDGIDALRSHIAPRKGHAKGHVEKYTQVELPGSTDDGWDVEITKQDWLNTL